MKITYKLQEAANPFNPTVNKRQELDHLRTQYSAAQDRMLTADAGLRKLLKSGDLAYDYDVTTADKAMKYDDVSTRYVVKKSSLHRDRAFKLWARYSRAEKTVKRMEKKIKNLRQPAMKAHMKELTDQATAKGITSKQIPPEQVPAKVPIPGTVGNNGQERHMNNPYMDQQNVIASYAGHPAHFPWFGKHRTVYLTAAAVLEKNKLPPLNILYAVVVEPEDGGQKFMRYILHNNNQIVIADTRTTGGVWLGGKRTTRQRFVDTPEKFIKDGTFLPF